MKTIELTHNLVSQVDDEDFEELNKHRWYACVCGNLVYARRYLPRTNKGRKFVAMHRQILREVVKNGLVVDHINGNGLDNRRSNLRVCTRADNNRNAAIRKDSVSSLKGSRFMGDKYKTKPWQARIRMGTKMISLGSYRTREEAAVAYDLAAISLYGAFAKCNFTTQNQLLCL